MKIALTVLLVINVVQIFLLRYVRRNWIDKRNKLLYNILLNSVKDKNLSENTKRLVNTIKDYFSLDYATIFIYEHKDRNKLSILSTTIDKRYYGKILMRGQQIIEDNISTKDAYIESSKTNLYYESAKERNIKYMYFVKLIQNNEVIGALMVESTSDRGLKIHEIEFFKSVVDSVSIYLQNIKFRRIELEQSNKDGLTGVLNRKMFDTDIREVIREYVEFGNAYSIVMLDIDHFKNFNDTYGHQCGDEVLKTLVKTIRQSIRTTDKLYRYGGEEFCIIMPNTTPENIVKHIDHIRQKIQMQKMMYNGQEISITCSFGISGLPKDGANPSDLIKKADHALYESKNTGRNKVTIYKK